MEFETLDEEIKFEAKRIAIVALQSRGVYVPLLALE